MEKIVSIEVHAPHKSQDCDEFLIVRVEGSTHHRVGDRIDESDLDKLCQCSGYRVTQTGVWGSPRRS